MDVDTQPHLVEVVAALKEITARITSAATMAEAVRDLAKVVSGILPAGVECGVVMIAEGEPATFGSTGAAVELLDEWTHSGADGPAIEAIRTRDIVLCEQDEARLRWPAWSALAHEHDVVTVLSYPFDVDTVTLGALTLYASGPGTLSGDLPIVAMLVADHASLLLRARLRQFGQETAGAEPTVQRAVGIIMAQRGCPPDQALHHLHEAATQLGVSLPDVAERLVQTVADRSQ